MRLTSPPPLLKKWKSSLDNNFNLPSGLKKLAVWLFFSIFGLLFAATVLGFRFGYGMQERTCIEYKMIVFNQRPPSDIKRGDYVAFVTEVGRMGHGFDGNIVIKKIGAVAGDKIRVHDGVLYINGEKMGQLDLAWALHKTNSDFERNEVVPEGAVFMYGTKPRSYDSRYWGLLPVSDITGSAWVVM